MAKRSKQRIAPGSPGKIPGWTHAAKTGIGKALNAGSHISFSISSGAITESYYPREDTACLGESFFMVTGDDDFVSDERHHTNHSSEKADSKAPAFKLTNTCKSGRYVITKEIIADPLRNCLLQHVTLKVTGNSLRLHTITIPRFPKNAKIRRAYVAEFNGTIMLFAETNGMVLAVACSVPFLRRSVGYLGKSDGAKELQTYAYIKHEYDLAKHGNVSLAAEIDLNASDSFMVVSAFGHSQQEAGHNAIASLLTGFDSAKESYTRAWQEWHNQLWSETVSATAYPLLDSSATVLRVSESKLFPGGILARIKKALEFIDSVGPASDQDRWEEESGVNTFSLATQISAFIAGSNLAGHFDDEKLKQYYLQKADELNDRIELLTYVTDTPLAREHGVDGYYIRLNPGVEPADKIKNKELEFNKPGTKNKLRVYECIGVDALALVRFGLRSAHDQKILNTVKIIDSLLKVELKTGTCWRRYIGDIYGEDKNGNPYNEDGISGIGRPWPLLTGERAHYEIAAGNFDYAKQLLESMNKLADNGFLSEQVWDDISLPDKKVHHGKPTGSAMPLTWAHAEYIKLCRSIEDKKVFDMPGDVQARYVRTV